MNKLSDIRNALLVVFLGICVFNLIVDAAIEAGLMLEILEERAAW